MDLRTKILSIQLQNLQRKDDDSILFSYWRTSIQELGNLQTLVP